MRLSLLTPAVYFTLREEGYQYLLLVRSVKDKDKTCCLYDAIRSIPKMCDIERAVAIDNDILDLPDGTSQCDEIYVSYDVRLAMLV